MRRLVWLAPIILCISVSGSRSAPLKGAHALKSVIGGNSQMEFEKAFRGGERACVIAIGDHKPAVPMRIAVYDDAKQLVAEDQYIDFVAAIWYPPRDGTYKIVVANSGMEYNKMYLVFK